MTDSRSFGVWGEGTRLAVLGDPVGHSRSPALHAAAYAALGLPWRYGRHRVERSGLSGFLAGRGPGWRGLSVTMPLKAEALRAADRTDGLARLTGAVNTLVFDGPEPDARISGWNTDVEGVRRALAGADASSTDLLGAGSTAASIVAALAEEGCRRLRVVVREPARAAAVLELAERTGMRARALRLDAWTAQEDTSLVV
ncbi:MAG: shikimate dehydrogenase, partial [Pseudoclavibacter sp.]|nr:shikimate dehydrogenase [Pseudoclavibacter sp.]